MSKESDDHTLMSAIRTGDLETVRNCAKNGIDLDAWFFDFEADNDDHVYAPLGYAATHGHIDIVSFLLDQNVEIDTGIDSGDTPLVAACCYGHIEIVQLLIQRGAKVNYEKESTSDYSPLWFAAQNGNWEIAKILLESGADLTEEIRDKIRAAQVQDLKEFIK